MGKTIKISQVRRAFLIAALTTSLIFAGCGNSAFKEHRSAGELYPEEFLPANPSLVSSYSLMDEEQNFALTELMNKVGDKNKASKTVTESFGGNFGALNLDYEKDLSPAFGEKFRVVFATVKNGESNKGYSVITLADKDKMKATFDTLAGSGKVSKKTFEDYEAYVNEENKFFASIKEDLLLIGNTADALSEMVKMERANSLWDLDGYQNSVAKIGAAHVFYAVIYPQNAGVSGSLLSLGTMASVLNEEVLVLRAQEDGLKFEGFAGANKSKAKDAGISFNDVPKEKAYLYKELPSDGLMFYAESYGLKQAFTSAGNWDENEKFKSFSKTVQNYLGMNLKDEILSFMDKGYVVEVSKNGSAVFPGITLYFDIGSDKENAEKFITKVDAQITGFMTVLSAALPGAVTKEKKEIMDKQFDSLKIDFSKIPRTGSSPLPTVLTSEPIELSYGIVDDRLLITTYNEWNADGKSVGESELYTKLSAKLDDAKQGLLLVDTNQIGTFAGTWRALREQLGLEVDKNLDLQKALEGFAGAIASSDTSAYEATMEGFLGINE